MHGRNIFCINIRKDGKRKFKQEKNVNVKIKSRKEINKQPFAKRRTKMIMM